MCCSRCCCYYLTDAVRLACSKESALARAPREETRRRTVWATVVDVYDGDTLTLAVVSRGIVRRRCRVADIDAPEMRGVSTADKAAAVRARDYLRDELCPRGVFRVRCTGHDKYGRLLVAFAARGGGSVAQRMVAAGHAYEYHGGTKRSHNKAAGRERGET